MTNKTIIEGHGPLCYQCDNGEIECVTEILYRNLALLAELSSMTPEERVDAIYSDAIPYNLHFRTDQLIVNINALRDDGYYPKPCPTEGKMLPSNAPSRK